MAELSQEESDFLQSIYFNPANPASFSGPLAVFRYAKEKGKKMSYEQIKQWVQDQESYSRNMHITRKFQRRRVLVTGIDDQWDTDLAQVDSLKDSNDGVTFLLCVIDIFSRFAWVRALKNKAAKTVGDAFHDILSEESMRIPKVLRTDSGKEFLGKKFQEVLAEGKIRHFTTNNEKKS